MSLSGAAGRVAPRPAATRMRGNRRTGVRVSLYFGPGTDARGSLTALGAMMRRIAVLAVSLMVSSGVAAATAQAQVAQRPCAAPELAGAECGVVTVPLDHANAVP